MMLDSEFLHIQFIKKAKYSEYLTWNVSFSKWPFAISCIMPSASERPGCFPAPVTLPLLSVFFNWYCQALTTFFVFVQSGDFAPIDKLNKKKYSTEWTIHSETLYFVDCESADVRSKFFFAQMKDIFKGFKMTPTLLWCYE